MNGRTNSTSTSDIGIIDIPLDPPTSFVCEARNSKVDITWVDPKDKYATPEGEQMEDTDQLVSVWAYTKIVRKEGSQPSSPSDGITVYTSDIRNQHQSAIYEDTGVTNGVTYYYAAYAYNTDGVYSDGAFSSGVTPIEWSTVLSENSWEQIDSACTQGVAQSLWEIGDEHPITVSNQNLTAVIIDFNHDNLADGSGKAVITFNTKETIRQIPTINTIYSNYGSTLNVSLYAKNSNDTYVTNIQEVFINIYEQIDSGLKNHIKSVNKIACCSSIYGSTQYGMDGIIYSDNENVYTFPLSYCEIGFTSSDFAAEGTTYPYFSIKSNLIKHDLSNSNKNWFLRSVSHYSVDNGGPAPIESPISLFYVATNGEPDSIKLNNSALKVIWNMSFCFCVGKSSV